MSSYRCPHKLHGHNPKPAFRLKKPGKTYPPRSVKRGGTRDLKQFSYKAEFVSNSKV